MRATETCCAALSLSALPGPARKVPRMLYESKPQRMRGVTCSQAVSCTLRADPACQHADLGGKAGHQCREDRPRAAQRLLLRQERMEGRHRVAPPTLGRAQGQFEAPRRLREGREVVVLIHWTLLSARPRLPGLPLRRAGAPGGMLGPTNALGHDSTQRGDRGGLLQRLRGPTIRVTSGNSPALPNLRP